jgi:excinuclease ABC subunit C
MREALSRRFEHLLSDESGSFSKYPDLILLDGGRGHVSVVKELITKMEIDVPVFGMVKDEYHKTRALTTEDEEISIAREQPVFLLIYKIQEEVHRYTISRMSNAKRKSLRRSTLEDISGIGPTKAKALLSRFGGLKGVKEAELNELLKVKGISEKDANNIIQHFKKV